MDSQTDKEREEEYRRITRKANRRGDRKGRTSLRVPRKRGMGGQWNRSR